MKRIHENPIFVYNCLTFCLQEVMKRYKAVVAQLSIDQITLQEQSSRISEIEEERNKLKELVCSTFQVVL